jgi:hypothetical protein
MSHTLKGSQLRHCKKDEDPVMQRWHRKPVGAGAKKQHAMPIPRRTRRVLQAAGQSYAAQWRRLLASAKLGVFARCAAAFCATRRNSALAKHLDQSLPNVVNSLN